MAVGSRCSWAGEALWVKDSWDTFGDKPNGARLLSGTNHLDGRQLFDTPARDLTVSWVPARQELFVVSYRDHMVEDLAVLVDACVGAGFLVEVVDVSELALEVGVGESVRVWVGGRLRTPDVVVPRGVNRPWPFVRQVLAAWERDGVCVVPGLAAADTCVDKLETIARLASAGVATLSGIGVVAGDHLCVPRLFDDAQPVVAKPARGSKGRGVVGYASLDEALERLCCRVALRDTVVDHQLLASRADGWGCDWRAVVADRGQGPQVVSLTRRHAPGGTLRTNAPGHRVFDEDLVNPSAHVAAIVFVAEKACVALGLCFGGVDVIEHEGEMRVLEVNAWPGLAPMERGSALAEALAASARVAWQRARITSGH